MINIWNVSFHISYWGVTENVSYKYQLNFWNKVCWRFGFQRAVAITLCKEMLFRHFQLHVATSDSGRYNYCFFPKQDAVTKWSWHASCFIKGRKLAGLCYLWFPFLFQVCRTCTHCISYVNKSLSVHFRITFHTSCNYW